jgi:hypothetical protein
VISRVWRGFLDDGVESMAAISKRLGGDIYPS